MTTYTHQIISMKRGATSGSASPMWRCVTKDGEKVNIFKHPDPNKNSYGLFADYWPEMEPMIFNQETTWKQSPIEVVLTKNGQWWDIVAVGPRPAGAQADPDDAPDHTLYRLQARRWADYILDPRHPVIIWDTETTGLDDEAEIVSIAALWNTGEQLLTSLIRPQNPAKLLEKWGGQIPAEIHGLTPESLSSAPTFAELYRKIMGALDGEIWVIYNAEFDTRILNQTCLRHGVLSPVSIGVNDAMRYFAQFHGEWNPVYKQYTSKKLDIACNELGVQLEDAHTAWADARATLELIRRMAGGEQHS